MAQDLKRPTSHDSRIIQQSLTPKTCQAHIAFAMFARNSLQYIENRKLTLTLA